MNYSSVIDDFKSLPDELKRQVADFIHFLVSKKKTSRHKSGIKKAKPEKKQDSGNGKGVQAGKVSDLKNFLLSGPEMTDEQYKYVQEKRQHLNAWK